VISAWIWPLGVGCLGAVIGSFIAALVIRWPQGRSVLVGRSACDSCGKALGPVDLVPILSAVWLRGRCRFCDSPIDPRHWQIELAAAGIGVIAGLAAPMPLALAGALFGWMLLTLAALDIIALWLPDVLTGLLAIVGIGVGLLDVRPPLFDRAIGGLIGYLALWSVAFAYRAIRRREGLGGGDPKLFGAIGLWIGWRMLPFVLLAASLAGLTFVLARIVAGKPVRADDRLPFGALLAIAAYPAWLVMIALAL
jgi:leader peptidase (prepilin peptidase)/N-methyltransferase